MLCPPWQPHLKAGSVHCRLPRLLVPSAVLLGVPRKQQSMNQPVSLQGHLKAILSLPLVIIYRVLGEGLSGSSRDAWVAASGVSQCQPCCFPAGCDQPFCSGPRATHCLLPSRLQWLETRPNRQVCPVCKAGISRDKVIPLYGRGSTGQQDPR